MASSRALQKSEVVAKTVAKFAMTTGEMIDRLFEVREEKRALDLLVAAKEGEYKGIADELMAQLEDQKTIAAKGSLASASITSTVTASVQDWDALNKYIKRTGHFHLYQRRLSDPAYRELLELKGGAVPGVVSFVAKKLNLRVNSFLRPAI